MDNNHGLRTLIDTRSKNRTQVSQDTYIAKNMLVIRLQVPCFGNNSKEICGKQRSQIDPELLTLSLWQSKLLGIQRLHRFAYVVCKFLGRNVSRCPCRI